MAMLRRLALPLAPLAVGIALVSSSVAAEAKARKDVESTSADALPEAARARLGSPHWMHPAIVTSLAYSPDGKSLVSTGFDGTLRFWDVATGAEQRRLGTYRDPNVRSIHDAVPLGACFSADGKRLAAMEGFRTLRVWDTASGREILGLDTGDAARMRAIALAPDGKTAAIVFYGRSITLVDVDGKRERRELAGHEDVVSCASFSHDGQTLFSGSEDLTLRAWDVASGKTLRIFEGHRDGVRGLAVSADDKTLASISYDGTLRLWEVGKGQERRRIMIWRSKGPNEQHRAVPYLCLRPDGASAVAGLEPGICQVWDLTTGKETLHVDEFNAANWNNPGLGMQGSWSGGVALAPDGKTFACAQTAGRIRLVEIATGKEAASPEGHQGTVTCAALTRDGKMLATGGIDHTVRLWDMATGKELRVLQGHSNTLVFVAFTPDGRTLLSASLDPSDKTLGFWDVATGKELRAARTPGGTSAAALTPDGKTVYACNQNVIHLWDVATREQRAEFPGRGSSLTLSPDGKLLGLASQDSGMQVWDTAGGGMVRALNSLQSYGLGTFSPDSKVLAVAGTDSIIRLHGVHNDRLIRTFGGSSDERPYLGAFRLGNTPAMVFSPDGRTIATAGKENSVLLWEAATGQIRRRLLGHGAPVTTLVYGHDGRTLVTGCADGTVLIWDLDRLDEAEQASGAFVPDTVWDDLAGLDPVRAFRSMRRLYAAPKQATTIFKNRIKAADPEDQKRIAGLITELDADDFDSRKAAMEELGKLGDRAEPALLRALAGKPSAEAAQRINTLLATMPPCELTAEERRQARSVEALEHLGTGEARQVLETLAKGPADARLTVDAKRALERLTGERGGK